jgi:predicted DNA helicase
MYQETLSLNQPGKITYLRFGNNPKMHVHPSVFVCKPGQSIFEANLFKLIMKNSQEELERLLELLRIEMEEDRKQYQEKMKFMTLQQRKEEGFTWYPLRIKDTYYGIGERLILEVERTSDTNIPHQFGNGKMIRLFSNSDKTEEGGEMTGVISAVRENFLKIVFFADELPDWVDYGKLGVELQFDETTYKEMEAAVKTVIKARNCRAAELREILLGYEKPIFLELSEPVKIPSLNESQNKAVNKVLEAEDVAIIHGPPGTGKTTTLVEAIIQVLDEEEQVMVCAPSNTAIDLITEKLAQRNVRVLRIGNPARINEEQLRHTIDMQVTGHRDYKKIKELRKSANELRNMALKYKRQYGRTEREQRKMVMREARKMADEAGAIEDYITNDLIDKARVITCTLVGSVSPAIKERTYSTIFIDEAAQALEPGCWIPILKADKVVFAGDHCQLPPTVKCFEAAKAGLSVTLFEKCIERTDSDTMLETQYRMNEKIMEFSNRQFYGDKLKAAEAVKNHLLAISENPVISAPVQFIDTAGCGYSEDINQKTLSTFNEEEAKLLVSHFKLLIQSLKTEGHEIMGLTAGIIAPYKAQTEILKSLTEKDTEISESGIKLSVNTVDGFQGQERDIIYISLVRSNEKREIGFLGDVRRMNVALTRARKKLVVIGDSATLGEHPFYKNFLNYIDEIKAYYSAWEYINL